MKERRKKSTISPAQRTSIGRLRLERDNIKLRNRAYILSLSLCLVVHLAFPQKTLKFIVQRWRVIWWQHFRHSGRHPCFFEYRNVPASHSHTHTHTLTLSIWIGWEEGGGHWSWTSWEYKMLFRRNYFCTKLKIRKITFWSGCAISKLMFQRFFVVINCFLFQAI